MNRWGMLVTVAVLVLVALTAGAAAADGWEVSVVQGTWTGAAASWHAAELGPDFGLWADVGVLQITSSAGASVFIGGSTDLPLGNIIPALREVGARPRVGVGYSWRDAWFVYGRVPLLSF